uniref:Uncharacterized protein n=1 Tax=Marseillevirus LCMAC101 TaxID=2506602 RepID=A0A481YSG4_9VIRU|nr:MAG: hypothetical protein LCMAC101_05050 [Marseillevirus LCMAC101]
MYPPVDDVHPQIKMVRRMHLNQRGPNPVNSIPPTRQDYLDGYVPANSGWSPHMSGSEGLSVSMDMDQGRLEGFYTHGPHAAKAPPTGTRYQSSGLTPFFQHYGKRDGPTEYPLNQEAPGIHMKCGQQGPSSSGFIKATMVTEPGKLPDPNGYATGCSACTGCPGCR